MLKLEKMIKKLKMDNNSTNSIYVIVPWAISAKNGLQRFVALTQTNLHLEKG